jgi:hypothetical protein
MTRPGVELCLCRVQSQNHCRWSRRSSYSFNPLMLVSLHHVGVTAFMDPVNVKPPSVQDSSWHFNPSFMEWLMEHCNMTGGLHPDTGRGSHILASWKVMFLETAATGRPWPRKWAEAPIEEGIMSTKWLSLKNFTPFAHHRGSFVSRHDMKAYRGV